MSGNSGRGNRSSISRVQGISDSGCQTLRFETPLNSPNPALLPLVKAGDCLGLALSTISARTVVIVLKDKQEVGSITGSSLPDLIECMRKGFNFKCYVLEVSKGFCKLAIESGTCP